MLQQSISRLDDMSPDVRDLVEAMASASMASGLTEDLIPPSTAAQTTAEHREQNTEDWQRATSASMASLDALFKLGYKLERPS